MSASTKEYYRWDECQQRDHNRPGLDANVWTGIRWALLIECIALLIWRAWRMI